MAVYKNFVVPRPQINADIEMSLKAAEKARRASEDFIQKVNDLIPEDPQKYHKDLLKGIDGKLALLKKNVAYLVMQNLTLIDKLMDAENTVHQVRSLQDLRNNWKDRPHTFAAPDSPNEDDFNANQDRTKCESWCNPSIDFLIFKDNASDLQSRKFSLTNKFVTNRLRQYIMREDMIDFLEPHLATYLFSNQCKEKDSDNDSGTGEEIVSPDEFESSSKFDQLSISSVTSSTDKLDDIDHVSKLGNFSVLTCSEGIVAEKSGDKVIGIVRSVLTGSKIKENTEKQESENSKICYVDKSSNLTMVDLSPKRQNTLLDEFKRRGFSSIEDSFSGEKPKNGEQKTDEDIIVKTNPISDLSSQSSDKTQTQDKQNGVKRNPRISSIRGQFEKDATSKSSVNSEINKPPAQISAGFPAQVTTGFPAQVISGFSAKGDLKSRLGESHILQKQFSDDSVVRKNDDSDVVKTQNVLLKSASLNFASDPTLSAYPRQRHYGKTYRKHSLCASDDGSNYISFDKKENKNLEDRDNVTPDQRINFSSKVNRGNKLRKSKRIEESHRFFESNKNNNSEKPMKADPSLRYVGTVNRNTFSENRLTSTRYVSTIKHTARLENSQGDFAGP